MTEELKINEVYMVGLGLAEARPGVYLGANRKGNMRVLVRPTEKDKARIDEPRVYNFREYTFKNKIIRITSPSLVTEVSKAEQDILKHLLESRGL